MGLQSAVNPTHHDAQKDILGSANECLDAPSSPILHDSAGNGTAETKWTNRNSRACSDSHMDTDAKLNQSSQARKRLLSVAEVADLLQVPSSWVYDRTRSRGVDRLPGFRLGKYLRFDETEVFAWLERQRSGGRVSG